MAAATTTHTPTGTPTTARKQTRVELSEPLTVGERIADNAAALVGNWRFIIVQTILVCLWVIVNIIAWDYKWDPYPFILLNLMFSVQAAYTGPILLLASNRQAAKDRAMAWRDDEELGNLTGQERQKVVYAASPSSSNRGCMWIRSRS